MEKLFFYLILEMINYSIMPYEIFVLKFSFRQSIICRLFASLTDIFVVYFFLSTNNIWSVSQEKIRSIDHILAGIKLASQSPIVYIIKIVFVNQIIIKRLQKWHVKIEIINWPKIGKAMLSMLIICFIGGTTYSIFRAEILLFLKELLAKLS